MSEAKIEAANLSKGTVTVACKLPHGLLLRGGVMIERDEPILGGGYRSVKMWQPTGVQVKINGYAVPFGIAAEADLSGGFALTPNIDATFWENWMNMNKEHPAVKSGLIFAMPSTVQAKDKAIERAAMTNGLEPMRRHSNGTIDDTRVPRGVTSGAAASA